MTAILGLSAFYHDSAAALLVDGRIVAAAQEERFTRRRHDAAFPRHAVDYCLAEAGLQPDEVDWIGFYDKPLLKLERLLETYLALAPRGFRSFAQAAPTWLQEKAFMPRVIARSLPARPRRRIVFAEHHESHAASAFFPSPFDEAALLTMDGVGEWATATLGVGRGNRIELTHQLDFPHSLGLLYSAFTYHAGFRVNSGEYKLMGLAPYGSPVHAGTILDKLLDLKDDGSFRLDMSYFDYAHGLTMTSRKFEGTFGPRRLPEAPLTQRDMDLAASIQVVTEEVVLRAARHLHRLTGLEAACLAGGVALNCVATGRLLREGPFRHVWVQPASGDAGAALGVALLVHHQLLGNPRRAQAGDSQQGSLLGPRHSDDDVERALRALGAVFVRQEDEQSLCADVADALARGEVVGWFQGRMEFGPRALGSRSILGDPRDAAMQSALNLKVKFRESFRPFAPSVLREEAPSWFELPDGCDLPYMTIVAPIHARRRAPPAPGDERLSGLERLRTTRSAIPAVTHVDGSARLQTVDEARHGRYYRLLRAFADRTGCPVLINTSFNVRGEPIVSTPEEAYRCFRATDIDWLVIESFLLRKQDQAPLSEAEAAAHRARFERD